MRRVSTRRLVKVTASLSAVMPSLVAFARGRPAHLRLGVALATLLALAGCNPSAAPADPGKAVVSVRFEAGGSHLTRSGISLGERLVVTAAPWTDKKPAFDSIEVLYDEGGPTGLGRRSGSGLSAPSRRADPPRPGNQFGQGRAVLHPPAAGP